MKGEVIGNRARIAITSGPLQGTVMPHITRMGLPVIVVSDADKEFMRAQYPPDFFEAPKAGMIGVSIDDTLWAVIDDEGEVVPLPIKVHTDNSTTRETQAA